MGSLKHFSNSVFHQVVYVLGIFPSDNLCDGFHGRDLTSSPLVELLGCFYALAIFPALFPLHPLQISWRYCTFTEAFEPEQVQAFFYLATDSFTFADGGSPQINVMSAMRIL